MTANVVFGMLSAGLAVGAIGAGATAVCAIAGKDAKMASNNGTTDFRGDIGQHPFGWKSTVQNDTACKVNRHPAGRASPVAMVGSDGVI